LTACHTHAAIHINASSPIFQCRVPRGLHRLILWSHRSLLSIAPAIIPSLVSILVKHLLTPISAREGQARIRPVHASAETLRHSAAPSNHTSALHFLLRTRPLVPLSCVRLSVQYIARRSPLLLPHRRPAAIVQQPVESPQDSRQLSSLCLPIPTRQPLADVLLLPRCWHRAKPVSPIRPHHPSLLPSTSACLPSLLIAALSPPRTPHPIPDSAVLWKTGPEYGNAARSQPHAVSHSPPPSSRSLPCLFTPVAVFAPCC